MKLLTNTKHQKIFLVFAGAVLLAASIIGASIGSGLGDTIRAFGLTAVSIVFILNCITIIWTLSGARSQVIEAPPDSITATVILGATVKSVAQQIMLIWLFVDILNRLGHQDITPVTPVTILVCTLLFVSWALIDRKIYTQQRNPHDVVRSIMSKDK